MKKVVWAGVIIGLGAVLGATVVAWAQHEEEEGPLANLHFVVLRDWNGKPIRNAAVVLHPVTRKGKQSLGGMELKTDDDGKTAIEGIPYGPLRVQVLAEGFQTFGEDYRIDKPEIEITVKMKRPVKQVTVYGVQEKKQPEEKKGDSGQKAGEQKPQ